VIQDFDFPDRRPDAARNIQFMLESIRSLFKEHHRFPTQQELQDRTRFATRTLKAYLQYVAKEWGLLEEGEGGQHYYEHVVFQCLVKYGEIEIADFSVPHIEITPEFREDLEALPALANLISGVKSLLRISASASQPDNETMLRLEHLVIELEKIRMVSGPTFRRAQEILGFYLPDTYFRAGGEHPVWDQHKQALFLNDQTGPHPDNLAALQGVLGEEFLLNAKIQPPNQLFTRPGGNIVVLGSPASELLSRIHLGYSGSTYDQFLHRTDLLPLPFWTNQNVHEVKGRATRIFRNYRTGEVVTSSRPNWTINTDDPSYRYIPEVESADKPYLKTDYLLITRLRNCLTDDKDGSYFTSIAGAHGVGTKAIQLLMGATVDRLHRELLHDIDRELQGASEFQILIKVSEIDQRVTGFEPKRLQLEAAVPLRITDEQYAALHQWIQRQLQTIKQSVLDDQKPEEGSHRPASNQ
jgi:hypothetical protein